MTSLSLYRRTLMLTLGTVLLSGCGMSSFTPNASQPLGAIGGKAMGGEQAISGATVTLWETNNAGATTPASAYGLATQLGSSTTTGTDGFFDFGTPAPVAGCHTGQDVYVVIASGDAGGGTNDSILQAATLGPCGRTASFVVVNEITTVATAYALGNFASVSGTGSSAVIQIGAPVNNNSTASSNNVTSGTTSTASGLFHAFQNVTNLVDVTNGVAYTTTPAGNGAVPQALINTIADLLQTCVNSDGTTTAGTNCGKLFALTPDRSGTIPTNIFQAAMNMAKNPYVSSANITALFNLLPTQLAFNPDLSALATSKLHDWTLAISYPVPPPIVFSTGAVSTTGFPFMPSLDADDNVYVATTPANALSATQTSACLVSYTSVGALRFSGTFGCNKSGSSTTPTTDYTWVAPDALGDLLVDNYSTATGAIGVIPFSASTGSTIGSLIPAISTSHAPALAVNKLNDFYDTTNNNGSSAQTFVYYKHTTGTPGSWAISNTIGKPHPVGAGHDLVFDASGNAWIAETGSGTNGGEVGYLFYGTGFPSSSVMTDTPIAGGATTATTPNSLPIGIAIDGSGNAWATNDGTSTFTGSIGITKLTPSGTTTAPTAGTTITNTGFNQPQYPEVDGSNILWFPDTAGIHAYDTVGAKFISQTANITTTSTSGGFEPCYLGSSGTATACAQSWSVNSQAVAIDSTGSVWYLDPDMTGTKGVLFQIIGTATPTWPLLAQGQPGTEPQ